MMQRFTLHKIIRKTLLPLLIFIAVILVISPNINAGDANNHIQCEDEVCPEATLTPAPTSAPNRGGPGDGRGFKIESCNSDKPIGSPNLFQIDRVGSNATLYFSPIVGSFDKYIIQYGLNPSANSHSLTVSYGKTTGVVVLTVHDLDPKATYYFKVMAKNGCRPGEWSNVFSTEPKKIKLPKSGLGFLSPSTTGTITDYYMSTNRPISITIPELGITSNIENVGKTDEGEMGTPKNVQNVGLFNESVVPGKVGTSVIAGHLDDRNGSNAVFSDLHLLKRGSKIQVQYEDGSFSTFIVERKETSEVSDELAQRVFDDQKYYRELNLVTCAGWWSHEDGYNKRTVVYAKDILDAYSI